MNGPEGPLEVRIEGPRGPDSGFDLLIAHPHPLHGGTMDNKVVHTLARAGRDLGLRAIRFNFRGVGGSAGVHDQGRGEVTDYLTVAAGVNADSPGRQQIWAGFSFGAWIVAQAAVRAGRPVGPSALVLVAPPVQYVGFDQLPGVSCPELIVIARDDDIVPAEAVRSWHQAHRPSSVVLELPAGHFFHGSLPALKLGVEQWLGPLAGRPGSREGGLG